MATTKRMKREGLAPGASRTAQKGRSILEKLAPSLQKRGVPRSSYIVVNTTSGEFVTGKTRGEAGERFKRMHPGAKGWMQRFGDVSVESGDCPKDGRSSNLRGSARPHGTKSRIVRC